MCVHDINYRNVFTQTKKFAFISIKQLHDGQNDIWVQQFNPQQTVDVFIIKVLYILSSLLDTGPGAK